MAIKKPIFILGAARSGTTILYRTFVKHKDTAYFEHYSNKFYEHQSFFRYIPIMSHYRKLRYGDERPKPTEGQVWNKFAENLDHLTEKDVTKEIKNYYESAIKYQLKAFDAKRFVNKNPKHCLRLRWLNEMFPDAQYILIKRDTKAVVASFLQKIYNYKRVFPGKYSPYDTILEKFNHGKLDINASINFHKYVLKHLYEDLLVVKERTIEVDYQDLVNDTHAQIKKMYKFCDLKWYNELDEIIPKELERGNDEKWKTLSQQEQDLLVKAFPN